MIELHSSGVFWINGAPCFEGAGAQLNASREMTIAYSILKEHSKPDCSENRSDRSRGAYGGDSSRGANDPGMMRLTFDSLISHDITYPGIIQTARASGLERFPIPYVLTNCHNSLCASGGTINEDDHVFGLSAAKKYGGIYVPANLAVIHQFAREMMTGCGKMILGSDSHTRYGALGTMGIGEGGPELVKQLLGKTYDIPDPEVVLVYLTGSPRHGIGPHDVAISLCGATYKNGFVKNRILEFAGPGLNSLPIDFRMGVDVMTTETACLSSIWETDDVVLEYLTAHGRSDEYKRLTPGEGAYYDRMIKIDLSKVEPMAALPFHPSEAYSIDELKRNAGDILREVENRVQEQFGGKVKSDLTSKIQGGEIIVDQGIIAGCAGGMYDCIEGAASILEGQSVGNGYFSLSVYPSSVPVNLELVKSGVTQKLMECGAMFKPCFCGPCFGAGDIPANNALSIRHTTRNFPNREGSIPTEGQMSQVILMDALSIAATARNHGVLTAATDIEYSSCPSEKHCYRFDGGIYEKRVYFGFGKSDPTTALRLGPNITEWPKIQPLSDSILMELASVIHDPVTTTDELLPSGDASSYRSNPLKMASFALSRRDPEYVGRTERIAALEQERANGGAPEELRRIFDILRLPVENMKNTGFGSVIFAKKPGDGSAREQAASCQRILGGSANICYEYATKRYRSNCVNWGILPFTIDERVDFRYLPGDYIFIPGIRNAILSGLTEIPAKVIRKTVNAADKTNTIGDIGNSGAANAINTMGAVNTVRNIGAVDNSGATSTMNTMGAADNLGAANAINTMGAVNTVRNIGAVDNSGAAYIIEDIVLWLTGLTNTERQILANGCLMNYYATLQREQ
ncbi:MAG: hydratase [Oscillospiraceae bacterium]|nr:hydratase [Oscillospiraceae bacterium]